ncbi:hypothetical protein NPIL_548121 [Nephila pilipes]|uniref:Uncharacterized protein n=1 Tax=Nephila pilipes TaxID=299642 RepID=A0A8X6PQW4_NEPPI|nr:hypothetical protein NPIL_548121 [Nephila pilipes]
MKKKSAQRIWLETASRQDLAGDSTRIRQSNKETQSKIKSAELSIGFNCCTTLAFCWDKISEILSKLDLGMSNSCLLIVAFSELVDAAAVVLETSSATTDLVVHRLSPYVQQVHQNEASTDVFSS